MTSKKNMRTNRSPRRIHRTKGGRKKGSIYKKSTKKTTHTGPIWYPSLYI